MTLEFAKLGIPKNDGTQQVYLRYQYKDVYTGTTKYEYIPTNTFLPVGQLESLLVGRLAGKVAYKLQRYLDDTKERIDEFYKSTGHYPQKTWVVKREQKDKKTVINFIEEYKFERKSKIKKTSMETQQAMIETILLNFAKIGEVDKRFT